ncbi:hypothetical protein EP7_003159 [Isosphaeraceae bacterium EP7]
MFTSEPSLAQRITRMIAETPIIDPHSHIRCDQPGAPDLAALIGEHSISAQLRSVGMPAADLDASLPADERVLRSIPFLSKIRNTANAWCLFRIFRDLYDFDEPNLTPSNYRGLFDRVLATGGDPSWATSVLREKAGIQTVVTTLDHKSADPSKNPEHVAFRLDLHDLVAPRLSPQNSLLKHPKADYYDSLVGILGGDRPSTSERLGQLLRDWLDATVSGSVRFCSAFLPIEQRFHAPDESRIHFVLNQAAHGQPLGDSDIDELVRSVTWTILGWHQDHGRPFQIAFGTETLPEGGCLPRSQSNWTTEMCRIFQHFGRAKFDLMLAADSSLVQETAVAAGQLANVYLAGDWSHNVAPPIIERTVAARVQLAPMTKFSGFLSDARHAEWAYGRLQIVKKSMAGAFASLVAAGYYEEDEVPPILRQILLDTPRDLYGLS